jgi:hypothetical protein
LCAAKANKVTTRTAYVVGKTQDGNGLQITPAENTNIPLQVLDLVVETPILVLDGPIVTEHCLIGKHLLFKGSDADVQPLIFSVQMVPLTQDHLHLFALIVHLHSHIISMRCAMCSRILNYAW